jgi:hypothetical protein
VKNGTDMIKELVGAVPKQDTYLFKGIKIKKLAEKVLVLLQEGEKDVSKSRMPENVKILASGKTALLEITTPDEDVIEREISVIFKEKVYNSTMERKGEVRKAIAELILGPSGYFSEMQKEMVNKMFDIEVKSYFDKGFKRLRGIAYEELKKNQPELIADKHVTIGRHGLNISVRAVYECKAEECVETAFNDIKSMVNEFEPRNKKLYEKINDIYCEHRKNMIKTEPSYKNVEIDAVLTDSIEQELKKNIAEMEKLEANYTAEREKNLEANLKLAEECKKAINAAIVESLTDRTLQMDVKEEEAPTLIEYASYEDFVARAIKLRVTKDHQLFTVKVKFAARGKIKDMTLFNPYASDTRYADYMVARIDIRYNAGFDDENKRYRSNDVNLFVELMEKEDKVNIWLAAGIWTKMDEADLKLMKPYFDDDIKLIKEIVVK